MWCWLLAEGGDGVSWRAGDHRHFFFTFTSQGVITGPGSRPGLYNSYDDTASLGQQTDFLVIRGESVSSQPWSEGGRDVSSAPSRGSSQSVWETNV